MNSEQKQVFTRIKAFSFDKPGTEFTFNQRLARENAWSIEYTHRVIEEYQKFIFLAVFAGHIVTPSEPIDRVWHLHLTYTRSYWNDFCPNTLGQK
ncbi:MAG: TIGR04222 domain-containing membrane protein, partial [Cyanobacteria bacterium J06600_6]